ncbi:MAG: hypothetical protein CEN88_416 [Candidatus Berkelbacteria bacterium Licking1014_2]|uniref:Uncharacterized protein n=1 Tax=Candidatus Berkelbacteria bacterium Licking1014_2 TaxID=2017146 RepID=A0A554LSI8_9BACT|nr:MAG: hypothetical protein CEN88_416 [Candidatus Berkelbacteria bacterium Licking1014_2]
MTEYNPLEIEPRLNSPILLARVYTWVIRDLMLGLM